jgi:putative DNA primase/helicase
MESIETPIDRIISRLQRSGCEPETDGPGEWRANCPLHRGSKKNLGVKVTGDGTILIHCFHVSESGAVCPPNEILKVLDLSMHDLFVRRNRPASDQRQGDTKKKVHANPDAAIQWAVRKHRCQPTCFWIYYESHQGSRFELLRVYRFDPAGAKKDYVPVHPMHEGWQVGDPPGKLPLYGLPELAGAETVVVTEGEKCADLVRSMGLIATTSAHGAQSAKKSDWRPLAGKSVVLIPDNNEEGEGYILTVAKLLIDLEPVPAIRILRLPGIEKGHDIQQWIQEVVPETWDLVDCRIELEKLWSNVPIWEPPPGCIPLAKPQAGDDGPPKLTELGNAKRLIKSFGDKIRFDFARGCWLTWDGIRWAPDEDGAIWRYAKQIPPMLYTEAGETFELDERESRIKWGLRSEQRRVIEACVSLAKSEPGVVVMPSRFDRDPTLLNTPSGVVDLLTGDMRPQKPEDLLSKVTAVPYDPDCPIPRWLSVLNDVFAGDQGLLAYMKRAGGYSISGFTGEHKMLLCFGPGRNGKNTVLDTIRGVAGDYASVSDPKIFLSSGQNEHPAGLADLAGRRLVVTSEVDTGQQLAEGLVKRLTGDRTIKARFMNQNWFEFEMTAKIWMLANSKPEIQGQDEGIWSRISIIPFDVFIPVEKRIKGLSDILIQEEGPGILAWLVDGCREWHRIGLDDPERVAEATKSYRSEQDIVGEFIKSCCIDRKDDPDVRDHYRVETKTLYRRYDEWCKEMGERSPLTGRRFSLELPKRGYQSKPSDGKHYWIGLALKQSDPVGDEPEPPAVERTRHLPY